MNRSRGMSRSRSGKLIVGLGNPGFEYDGTRHNIGFEVVDRLVEQLPSREWTRFHRSGLLETRRKGRPVVCLKPGLYMNRSGGPTREAMLANELKPADVLVIHDDLDLPLGKLRLRARGSSGGHRGIADIIQEMGDAFHRLRFGIERAPRGVAVEDYVLEPFTQEERESMAGSIERAVEACLCWLDQGLQTAMNEFNRDVSPVADESADESTGSEADDAE